MGGTPPVDAVVALAVEGELSSSAIISRYVVLGLNAGRPGAREDSRTVEGAETRR
jgi:hypothetical protein